MRILVTGGRGYIGGRLVQALAADPNVAVTLASRARQNAESGAVLTVDWSRQSSIEEMCRGQDAIVHLAAMNEADCENDPEEAIRINGLSTLRLVESATVAGISRLIYVSTSKVFGNNPTGSLSETSLPHPVSHYAITHRLAEDYVLAANARQNLVGVVLRLSNSLGPPVHPFTNVWMLIANSFCRQAVAEQRISLRGSGLAWRNFIRMADVVTAIRHVLDLKQHHIGDGLFHLGGPRSDRIWDLAHLIAQRAEVLFGEAVELSRAEPGPNETHPPFDWQIQKLVATGWVPQQALTDELDDTLRMCREYL